MKVYLAEEEGFANLLRKLLRVRRKLLTRIRGEISDFAYSRIPLAGSNPRT